MKLAKKTKVKGKLQKTIKCYFPFGKKRWKMFKSYFTIEKITVWQIESNFRKVGPWRSQLFKCCVLVNSRLRIGLFSIECLQKSIDSGQSYLRLRTDSYSIEFLKESIDSGSSYLRLRNCSFSIGFSKKNIDTAKLLHFHWKTIYLLKNAFKTNN